MIGWDTARLSMVLAVLEARCGLALSTHDIYLAVAGGLRIAEPAADLAVAAALISSRAGIALPPDVVYFGEVSLSGRVRPVPHAGGRMKEAAKLGFRGAVVPPQAGADEAPCTASEVALLADLVHRIAPAGFAEDRQRPLIGDD